MPGATVDVRHSDDGERYVHEVPDRLLASVPPGRVLDIGCGQGGFGAALKARSADRQVFGIEPTDAAARASAVLDDVVQGSFPDDLPRDWCNFDVLTFMDVLEHFADPWATLRACTPLLAPGGKVMAQIPNIRCVKTSVELLVHGRWEYEDIGLLDRTHLRFFTRSSILQLFDQCGFTVERIEPWNKEYIQTVPARVLRAFGTTFDDLTSPHYLVVAAPR
jgi:2-polyprenyl-3-methyl-5-hydroxy-6-metoxy-1,4-benzoquinol methylase